MISALKINEELIGDRAIKISDVGEEVAPAIKNWLKDYDQSSNVNQRSRRLNLVEYINTNNNVRQLSAEQKETLRRVLQVYDFVRFLNQLERVSETGHKIPAEKVTVLDREDLASSPVEDESSKEQEIFQAYKGNEKQAKEIS